MLPGLFNGATTGPMVRECQRHLAQWQLQPMAALIGQEVSEKLGETVSLDVMRPFRLTMPEAARGRWRALSKPWRALGKREWMPGKLAMR